MAVELISVSPSPARDQDVFGKELRLSEADRKQLSAAGEIFLSKTLQVDSHSKKGDSTEPRTLVISSSRCYILLQNPATKVEASFNFLKIRQLQCSEHKLTFHLLGEAKSREFHSSRQDSVQVISLITAQLKNVFPKTSLDMFLKLTFDPDSLRNEVSSLRDELTTMMDRVDASTIQGFLTAYAFLCDFFGAEYNREVSWYLNNVYLAHGLREMKLSDFDHLSPKDFLPVVSSLRHNCFFEGVVEKDGKLVPEVLEELCHVLNSSHSIKTLVLSNCGLKMETIMRLSSSLKNNPRASLTHLDFSDNPVDDRAMDSLGSALESLPHGLQHLKLANCKISAKGASALANSMKQNKHMQFSLVHLDLSSNVLGPDPLGALSFLQETQTISTLKLSTCNLLLEHVVPVLNRSCTQHLCELDLSSNAGKGKKVVHSSSVASGLQQFCSSSISLRSLNLSNCKLSTTLVMRMLEGLAVNPNVTSVKLNLSSNDLSGAGAQQMLSVIGKASCLHHLNISDCSLDQNMADIVEAVTHNRHLRHLMLGKNFSPKVALRVQAVRQFASLLAREDCQLASLCLEDSHLKEHTGAILEALVDNTSLAKINLGGNQMGSRGARSLAKALLCNCSLSEVSWDHNETPLRGFHEIAVAMEQNYTLRVMPLPLYDIGRAGKEVEEHVQMIQQYLCRNHSDERLKVEIAARHRSRLLTASQQSSAVGRELVQLEDLLQWVQTNSPSHELVAEGSEVKDLANRAIKLTDGLYSPQVESEQFQTITRQVKELLSGFMEGLFLEHIKTKSEKMVKKSIDICDTLLSEETRQKLQNLVVCDKGEEFSQAKKDVLRHALPEIVNHVSDSNVDVAANIAELVVVHTLQSLEKINLKLFKLQKETLDKNEKTADAKVSRNFTFRVQDDSSPTKKKKKRVRRPDTDDEEDAVDLPSIPLETDGPVLQHLGKSRPKPARMQRTRISKKPGSTPASPGIDDLNPPAPDPTSPFQLPPPVETTPPSQPKVAMKLPSEPTPPSQPKVAMKPPSGEPTPPSQPKVATKPPSGEPTPPSVATKPPSPEMAEKRLKELFEFKGMEASKDVVGDDTATPAKGEHKEDHKDQHESQGEHELADGEASDEEGDNEGSTASDEVEEHRTVLQQKPASDNVLDTMSASPTSLGSQQDGPAQIIETRLEEKSTEPGVTEDADEGTAAEATASSPAPPPSSSPAPPIATEKPAPNTMQKEVKSERADSTKSKKSSFSKLFNRSKVEGKDGEGSQTRSKVERKEGEGSQKRVSSLMAEWEVVESSSVAQTSPSPEMIKKPPPVVKEKPRNKPASSASTEKNLTQDGKKVAILPSSQMASLANVLQKGVLKPNKNGDSENVPTSPKPVDVSKQETPRPTKSTPSPAPKPRPKPSIRKKAESPEIKVEDKSSKFQEKDEASLDTLV